MIQLQFWKKKNMSQTQFIKVEFNFPKCPCLQSLFHLTVQIQSEREKDIKYTL